MKLFLFFLSSAILVVVSLYFMTGRETGFRPKISYGSSSFMEDVTIEQKRSGDLKWMMRAEKAIHLSDDDIRLEGITVNIPEKDLKISAVEAMYNLKTKDFVIPGEINAETRDYKIAGRNLRWDSKVGNLTAEKEIRISGKSFVLEGDELTATSDTARLNKNVKAVFYGK